MIRLSSASQKGLFAFVLLVSLLISGMMVVAALPRNRAFHQALTAGLKQPPDYRTALISLETIAPQDCRIYWQISLLSHYTGNLSATVERLETMLNCSPEAVDWLFLMAPQRKDLALRAAQLYPQDAKVWLWLGDLASQENDVLLAEQNYLRSTRQDPLYGLAWCRLGKIKESQGLLDQAVDSFWLCCKNGDPGSNGCYGAGRVAEKLGDIPNAIRYYRHSHYQRARDRADELEATP